jgi:DNA modification methylase
VPALVLDPFLGAGTTALVADRLGRDCIGLELSRRYAEMAARRITPAVAAAPKERAAPPTLAYLRRFDLAFSDFRRASD